MNERVDIEFYSVITEGLRCSCPAKAGIRLTLKDKKLDKDLEVRKYLDNCAREIETKMDKLDIDW